MDVIQLSLPMLLSLVCIGLVFGACLYDVIGRFIPNWQAASLAVCGIGLQAANGRLFGAVLSGGAVFLLAFLCWRRGWMGGGDVKLLGAAATAVPLPLVPQFIAAVAIAGGMLALLYLVALRVVPAPGSALADVSLSSSVRREKRLFARVARIERWRIHRGCPLPYACAIAAGFLFVVL